MKKINISLIIVFIMLFAITIDTEAKTICKRASKLSTQTCNWNISGNTGCLHKYQSNATITYGNLGATGILTSGDAFDCDVNGDGIFDSTKERFYYVTDLSVNNNYAVLIYNSNTIGGVASSSKEGELEYDVTQTDIDSEGPYTAIANLPKTSQWTNVSLSNVNRKITSSDGTELFDFSYAGYSARFLTIQELKTACGIDTISGGTTIDIGALDSCLYFIENTNYANSGHIANDYFLENLKYSGVNYSGTWQTKATDRSYTTFYAGTVHNKSGVRPVIEVNKDDIDLSVQTTTKPSAIEPSKGEKREMDQVVKVDDTFAKIPLIVGIVSVVLIIVGGTITAITLLKKSKEK